MAEKLTDEERGALDGSGWGVSITTGQKAIRIIDQLTRDLYEARSELKIAWEDDPLVPELRAEVARLKEALAAAERKTEDEHVDAVEQRVRAERAESECAALRAEVERLRDVRTEHDWQFKKRQEAESSLAVANKLLRECPASPGSGDYQWHVKKRTHLANQPTQPATVERTVLVHDDGTLKRVIEEPTYQQQRAEEAACAASDALLAKPETPTRAEENTPRADLDGRTPREMLVRPRDETDHLGAPMTYWGGKSASDAVPTRKPYYCSKCGFTPKNTSECEEWQCDRCGGCMTDERINHDPN